jgi:hypothetical protein
VLYISLIVNRLKLLRNLKKRESGHYENQKLVLKNCYFSKNPLTHFTGMFCHKILSSIGQVCLVRKSSHPFRMDDLSKNPVTYWTGMFYHEILSKMGQVDLSENLVTRWPGTAC